MIEPRLLETFIEVARRGSVSEATGALAVTQPAVSQRLNRLREEMEVELFERSGHDLILTEYGERLFDRATRLLSELNDLPASVRLESSEPRGSVTVGTFPALTAHYFDAEISGILEDYPGIHLAFRFGMIEELHVGLEHGEIDVVVVVGDHRSAGFERRVIGSVEIVAAMAPEMARPDRRVADLDHVRTLPYLAWEGPSDPTFDRIRRYVYRHELQPETAPEIPHIETLRRLAVCGAGYTILPAYAVRDAVERGDLVLRELPEVGDPLPVYAVHREEQVIGPAVDAVLNRLGG